MAVGHITGLVQEMYRLVARRQERESADSQLVARVAKRRDEAAFTELVERHGPMVLGVCHRVLRNEHDAEDAFQATFLVLARKAGTIRKSNSVASWLYGVAQRAAQRMKRGADRRRRYERGEAPMTAERPPDEVASQDVRAILDEELGRLPVKYRSPLVLCHLQGKTHEEAAQELGRPAGSMSRYLARGQELLRQRLVRRGLAPSGAVLATILTEKAGAAPVLTPSLKQATISAALAFAGAAPLAGGASASVLAIADGILRAMALARGTAVAALVLVLGIAGTGAGFAVHRAVAARLAAGANEDAVAQAGEQLSVAELVGDLRSTSFEVRQRAEKALAALGPGAVPDLRRALAKEKDLDMIGRLERVIENIEGNERDRRVEEFRRRFGIRGEDFRVTRFGPFEPGPVEVEVFVPGVITWVDGIHYVMTLTNRGKEPVQVAWFRMAKLAGWEESEEIVNSQGGYLSLSNFTKGGDIALPNLQLAPGETATYRFFRHDWDQNGGHPKVAFKMFLHANLKQGSRQGKLQIHRKEDDGRFEQPSYQPWEWEITTRPASDKEVAAAVREVAELCKHNPLGKEDRKRLLYLVARRENPQDQLAAEQLQGAYELQASRDVELADHFFDALIRTVPEKEVLSYAAQRVRGGDGLPLAKCADQLPRERVVPAALKLLKAKEPNIRCRAAAFLAGINETSAGPPIAELLKDPDVGVRQVAVQAVQKLQHPCADKIAALLADSDEIVRRDAAEALVSLKAKEQVPALQKALRGESKPYVAAAFLVALGKLGGPAAEVRKYLWVRDTMMQAGAIRALGDLGAASDAEHIARILESAKDGDTESAAIYALGKLRSRPHVDLICKTIASHDAYCYVGFAALGEIGGERAVAALKEFAVDRPIALDREQGRAAAVKALVPLLPADQRFRELSAILQNPRANAYARGEALRQLEPLGPGGVRLVRDSVADPQVGLTAMSILWRYSAPKRFGQPPTLQKPLKGWNITFGQLPNLLAMPVRIEGVDGLDGERLWIYYDSATLPEILLAIARSRDNSLGVIFTDDVLRVVPRNKAIEFYSQLLIE
jgi:RNA polymerase sigma factor (sigma-70 family)